jgi:hypothetical protein
MNHRLPVAVLVVALALTACGSDDADSTTEDSGPGVTEPVVEPATTDTTDTTATSDTASDTSGAAEGALELSDAAPDGADIVIDAAGITTDRSIRRGGQPAIEQGQTFAVDADTTLTGASFLVVAPGGVSAGQPVELTVYEVGNTVTMVPSGYVDIGSGANGLVVSLPDAIAPDTPTHLVFSLPDVAMSPGQYAVVLSFGDGAGAGAAEMFMQHPDGDVYADGVAISLEGETWKSNTNDHDSAVTITFDG